MSPRLRRRSKSEQARALGNKKYLKAKSVDGNLKRKVTSALKARSFYCEAVLLAAENQNHKDWRSAMKNLGSVEILVATMPQYQKRNSKQRVVEITDELFNSLPSLDQVCAKTSLYLLLIEAFVKQGFIADDNENGWEILKLVKESSRCFAICKQNLSQIPQEYEVRVSLQERLANAEHDHELLFTRGESFRLCKLGSMLVAMLLDLERKKRQQHADDARVVELAINHFKAAIHYSCYYKSVEAGASNDIQSIATSIVVFGGQPTDEDTSMKSFDLYARACSGLGELYEKVLLMYNLGRQCYMEAIRFAGYTTEDSEDNVVFFGKLWFQEAAAGIERDNLRIFEAAEADNAINVAPIAERFHAEVEILS
eukprot:gene39748-49122_t